MGKASRAKWERRIARAASGAVESGASGGKTTDFILAIVCLLLPQGWSMSGFAPNIVGSCVLWLFAALLTGRALWPVVKLNKNAKLLAIVAVILLIAVSIRKPVLVEFAKEHPVLRDESALPPAQANYMVSYGPTPGSPNKILQGKIIEGSGSSEVIANGELLLPYKDKFKLLALCLHIGANENFEDVTRISKSYPIKIHSGFVSLSVLWTPEFIHELEIQAANSSSTYALLLIPNSLEPKQINSISDAKSKGSYLLQSAGGHHETCGSRVRGSVG